MENGKFSTALKLLGALATSSSLNGCATFVSWSYTGELSTETVDVRTESRAVLAKYFMPYAAKVLSKVPVTVMNSPQQNISRMVRQTLVDPYGNVVGYREFTQEGASVNCFGPHVCGKTECPYGSPWIEVVNGPCCVHTANDLDRILVHEYIHAAIDKGLLNAYDFQEVYGEFENNPSAQSLGLPNEIDGEVNQSMNSPGASGTEDQLYQERVAYLGQKVAMEFNSFPDSLGEYFALVLKKCANGQ